MDTTTAANEENQTTNVVYMGDFLLRKLNHLREERDRLMTQAESLSKQDKDQFAAPVQSKAHAIQNKMDKYLPHLKFILRGGHGQAVANRGYSLSYGQQTPPPVKITVSGIPSN